MCGRQDSKTSYHGERTVQCIHPRSLPKAMGKMHTRRKICSFQHFCTKINFSVDCVFFTNCLEYSYIHCSNTSELCEDQNLTCPFGCRKEVLEIEPPTCTCVCGICKVPVCPSLPGTHCDIIALAAALPLQFSRDTLGGSKIQQRMSSTPRRSQQENSKPTIFPSGIGYVIQAQHMTEKNCKHGF